MKLFDVYPRYAISLAKGLGSFVWDEEGKKYLDLYGGHAVISIGHSHPHFINRVQQQLHHLAFYSNAVEMPIQEELANHLGRSSGYADYALFLCNSGAEAIENAIKTASFKTGRKKVIVFEKGFHGRTSLAVEATDNAKIQAEVNHTGNFLRLSLNDEEKLESEMDESIAAVMVEGIQGVGGIYVPSEAFLKKVEMLCKKYDAKLILDEIQSGYGRSGKFFAHQYAGIRPDIITMAKGMGNGFPIGGILISPDIKPWSGMLGSTFGGSHLACAAGLGVLEVMEKENLMRKAFQLGEKLIAELKEMKGILEVRGKGLMIGLSLDRPVKPIRDRLLFEKKIFTGSSSDPNIIRILPPLSIEQTQIDHFIGSLSEVLAK